MDVFAALADPVRRDLVRRLAAGPARVVDLAAEHPISRPAISRHLRLLVAADLAVVEERGRERHYRLRRAGLDPVRDLLAGVAPTASVDQSLDPPFADSVLDGLDLEVRRTTRERDTSADQGDGPLHHQSRETG